MKLSIHPKSAGRDAWKQWVEEGYGLSTESPWPCLVMLPGVLLPVSGPVFSVLMFALFAVGFTVARDIDQGGSGGVISHSKPCIHFAVEAGSLIALVSVFIYAIVVWAKCATIGIPADILLNALPVLILRMPSDASEALLIMGYYAMSGCIFIYPLREVGIGYGMAFMKSINALLLNWISLSIIGCILLALSVMVRYIWPLFIPLGAFSSCVFYVAWREVFLGEPSPRRRRITGYDSGAARHGRKAVASVS